MTRRVKKGPRRLTRSALFERVVQRIHELLERDNNAVVTWDDRIADPDSPKRKRQIDITIRKDNLLTLVECRLHQEPQDVTWIEELIGRRQSLRADSVIGVSSSGFTDTARTKADSFGIHLRELADLTAAEISDWGRAMKLEIGYHRFEHVEVTLVVVDDGPAPLTVDVEVAKKELWPLNQTLLNAAADKLHELGQITEDRRRTPIAFNILLKPHDCALHGRPIAAAAIKGLGHMELQTLTSPVVRRYSNPLSEHDKLARVQMFALGETSATFDGSNVSLALDLSTLQLPPLSQLRYVLSSNDEPVNMESFELIGGVPGLYASSGRIKLAVLQVAAAAADGVVESMRAQLAAEGAA